MHGIRVGGTSTLTRCVLSTNNVVYIPSLTFRAFWNNGSCDISVHDAFELSDSSLVIGSWSPQMRLPRPASARSVSKALCLTSCDCQAVLCGDMLDMLCTVRDNGTFWPSPHIFSLHFFLSSFFPFLRSPALRLYAAEIRTSLIDKAYSLHVIHI